MNDELFNWIRRKVGLLRHHTAELSKIDKDVFYDVRSWTPLKLVVLGYFTKVYTPIIPKYFKNMVYIDLFANSGINRVDEKDLIVGSPVVAIGAAKRPFNKINCKRFRYT